MTEQEPGLPARGALPGAAAFFLVTRLVLAQPPYSLKGGASASGSFDVFHRFTISLCWYMTRPSEASEQIAHWRKGASSDDSLIRAEQCFEFIPEIHKSRPCN